MQTLILNRAPQATLQWADTIASWDFKQIIPCHFTTLIKTTPQEFRQAFNFLEADCPRSIPEADLKTLQSIDALLYKSGIVPPPQPQI